MNSWDNCKQFHITKRWEVSVFMFPPSSMHSGLRTFSTNGPGSRGGSTGRTERWKIWFWIVWAVGQIVQQACTAALLKMTKFQQGTWSSTPGGTKVQTSQQKCNLYGIRRDAMSSHRSTFPKTLAQFKKKRMTHFFFLYCYKQMI